ncbi:MAG TPA: gamma-glutamyltransferase [Planctomycetota bacterium]
MLLPLLLALAPFAPQVPAESAGAAATSEPHATRAAAEILAAGGNAVDVAVAAGFALAVTYPTAGNLGGGGFLLYREPGGRAWFLDFREVAPAAAHPMLYRDADGGVDTRAAQFGWTAAGVPGSVPGLLEAHRRWGSLPREQLLAPAIRLAEDGFAMTREHFRSFRDEGELLRRDPMARRLFFGADGAPLEVGTLLQQPELAATLRRIAAEGDAPFRSGALVEELVAASAAGGGILTAADFEAYAPELRPVVRLDWHGLEILAAPPPSSGGVYLTQMLRSLEGHPLAEWGWADGRSVQLLGEASARAFADRNRWLGDPAGFDFELRGLLLPAMLQARSRALRGDRFTPSDALEPTPLPVAAAEPPQPPREGEETTHYSVVDAAGGAVAVTTTLNGSFGAKVMAPGGFFMNNEMDDFAAAPGTANQYGLVQSGYNAVRAGRRPLSSMCPAIVVRGGAIDAVVGSPGGPRILSAVLQVILNRYLFDMGPLAAVAAPRMHRQDRPATLRFEPGRLDSAARAFLAGLGQPVEIYEGIGDVNAIFRIDGGWRAVADPRWSGLGLEVEAGVRPVPDR